MASSEQERPDRILIVDDDRGTRLTLRAILEGAGYEFLEAGDGAHAIRVFERERPSLVLLDAMMPVMDGFDACRRLRGLAGDGVPILMVTSLDDDDAVERAFEAGAEDFVPKPVHAIALRARVQRLLEARRAARAARRLAWFDPVTGLANRGRFAERLEEALAGSRRAGEPLAVFALDLASVERVHDGLGHDARDRVLRVLARRLRFVARVGEDTITDPALEDERRAAVTSAIGRLDAHELAVAFSDIGNPATVDAMGRHLSDYLARPVPLDEHRVVVPVSVGIAVAPAHGTDAEGLIRSARCAMRAAAATEPGSCRTFEPRLDRGSVRRIAIESRLRRAIEHGELELHYQPQVSTLTGRTEAVEALLRWHDDALGEVPPDELVPIAEESGLVVPLGAWVLEAACRQLARWRASGLALERVAVNLSAIQLASPDLPDLLDSTLARTGLDPRSLELEITETSLVQHVERAREVLVGLRGNGVRIAIDDFGTGYSSLGQLRRLPVDRLKIDRSFVRDITWEPDSAAIADAVIAMARNLGIAVLAEGVETEAQLELLARRGCHEVQGYYVSRPLPAEEAGRYLAGPPPVRARLGVGRGERTVLVVDAEARLAREAARLLDGDSYRVLCARNAREGLEVLARERVGVLVTEDRLADLDGAELCRRASLLHPEVSRILLSDRAGASAPGAETPWHRRLPAAAPCERLRGAIGEAYAAFEARSASLPDALAS